MPTLGFFLICAIQAARSRGTIQKASPSHSYQTGVTYGMPFSSMVAMRATTGAARNSMTSAGVSLRFFPIHSGCCWSVISTSVAMPVSIDEAIIVPRDEVTDALAFFRELNSADREKLLRLAADFHDFGSPSFVRHQVERRTSFVSGWEATKPV